MLDVTDAEQSYASDAINVDVDPGADPGLFCY